MDHQKISAERAAVIEVGATVNYGDGTIWKIVRFEASPYKGDGLNSEYAILESDGRQDRFTRNALRGAVENDDETIRKCQYCGKVRPGGETVVVTIFRNHGRHNETFCADSNCATCAQMSAEG